MRPTSGGMPGCISLRTPVGRRQSSTREDSPWYAREDMVNTLAAISSLFPEEMSRRRKAGCPTTRETLGLCAQPERLEWLLNGMRHNHTVSAPLRLLRPVGTTGNEALHAELNAAFRRVQAADQEGGGWGRVIRFAFPARGVYQREE